MKNVCEPVRLEYMQIFPAGDQHQDLGVREEEPLAFTTPCSAAILPP